MGEIPQPPFTKSIKYISLFSWTLPVEEKHIDYVWKVKLWPKFCGSSSSLLPCFSVNTLSRPKRGRLEKQFVKVLFKTLLLPLFKAGQKRRAYGKIDENERLDFFAENGLWDCLQLKLGQIASRMPNIVHICQFTLFRCWTSLTFVSMLECS